jgi:lysyl-tRNA synthetase class 2
MSEIKEVRTPVEDTRPEYSEQETIRREKLQKLVEAGCDPYTITHFDQTLESDQLTEENFANLEGKEVSMAGRMIAKRIMGKASFAHILDAKGNVQLYLRREDLGEDVY